MTRDLTSEETVVVATYSSRHDAEAAKSYLEDQDIPSFVTADDVHPPLQVTEGSRLRVMTRDIEEAREALHYASMLPEEGAADAQGSGAVPGEHTTTRRFSSWAYIVIFLLIVIAIAVGLVY